MILTAFDSPSFDIKLAEDRIINNVIFKPFDKLILKQDLEFALTGHHPLGGSNTVTALTMNSTIEMLKEVSISSLSEISFTTINNHEIPLGTLTKYYSEAFKADHKKSMHAYCKSCKELSEKEFLCEFYFYAADSTQISQIRKRLLQNKDHQNAGIQNSSGPPTRILILDENAPLGLDFKIFLTERFNNSQVYIYQSLAQLLSDLADKETNNRQQLPETFDFVFASYEVFEFEKQKPWEQICELLKERHKKVGREMTQAPPLFLLSRKKVPIDEIREISTWCREIFFTPLDKLYITKKLVSEYRGFANKTPVTVASVKESIVLKVANPVEISQ
ncbi:MAG TPA: hypothetical protein VN132_12245, partial [Bdellovibrio sp.]|nr:hypothetical protein [Bdellovibrio sp.]